MNRTGTFSSSQIPRTTPPLLEPSSLVALRRENGRYDLGVRFEGFTRGVERDVVRFMELGRSSDGESPSSERLSMVDATVFWQRHEALRSEGQLRFRLQLLPTQLPEVEKLLEPLLASLEAPAGACTDSTTTAVRAADADSRSDPARSIARVGDCREAVRPIAATGRS